MPLPRPEEVYLRECTAKNLTDLGSIPPAGFQKDAEVHASAFSHFLAERRAEYMRKNPEETLFHEDPFFGDERSLLSPRPLAVRADAKDKEERKKKRELFRNESWKAWEALDPALQSPYMRLARADNARNEQQEKRQDKRQESIPPFPLFP